MAHPPSTPSASTGATHPAPPTHLAEAPASPHPTEALCLRCGAAAGSTCCQACAARLRRRLRRALGNFSTPTPTATAAPPTSPLEPPPAASVALPHPELASEAA